MPLSIVTVPAQEPIARAEAKLHLRETDSGQDARIDGLIVAARQWTEEYLRRVLIERTLDLSLDAFPVEFSVPRPPLISVTSITYMDTDGATQVLATSGYRVDAVSEPGRITPAYGESWPSIRPVTNAVVLRFKAGYGTAAASVPEPIRQAMLLLIGEMYERREQGIIGSNVGTIPFGVHELLSTYRILVF
ncbi:MAG: head-tail connector protein [Sulfuricaulis sp.]|nr:head-tail connector protein [Sulfuricaulis sp.]